MLPPRWRRMSRRNAATRGRSSVPHHRCRHRGKERRRPPAVEARNPSRERTRPALPLPSTLSVGYTAGSASCPTETATCQQRGNEAPLAPSQVCPGWETTAEAPHPDVAIREWLSRVRPSRGMGAVRDRGRHEVPPAMSAGPPRSRLPIERGSPGENAERMRPD
jgi:hypothetical protein